MEKDSVEEDVPGFLFAFLHYSRLGAGGIGGGASWVQRLVRVFTRSDVIHVAIVPVTHCRLRTVTAHHHHCQGPTEEHRDGVCTNTVTTRTEVMQATLAPSAFTAYIGMGFHTQDTDVVLTDEYEHLFLPVRDPGGMADGLHFLHSLHGAGYNYRALLLTVLPYTWKTRFPGWITQERADPVLLDACHPHLVHNRRKEEDDDDDDDNDDKDEDDEEASRQRVVFCSQMGLMLCYVCGALRDYTIDPAGCSPGELFQILSDTLHAVPAPQKDRLFIMPAVISAAGTHP